MKKVTAFVLLLLVSSVLAQNLWINEIHYDNDGADTGEFVEVVLENAGNYNLSDFTVTLYNGNGGASYDTKTLAQYTVGSTSAGFTIYYYNYTLNGGSLQNGAPDGLALDYQGTVISGQFLSYEGSLTATNGAANGLTSTDIGVSETSTTPVGQSLQLLGSGTQYSDFTWGGPYTATMGTTNSDGAGSDQTLPVELTSFTANAGDSKVTLLWSTASEVNNEGFAILRSTAEGGIFNEQDSYVSNNALNGAGNSSQSIQYSWVDNSVVNGNTYWYKLVDVDVDGIRTEHGPVSATPNAIDTPDDPNVPHAFYLKNYPNPFNPGTRIEFDLSSYKEAEVNVNLSIYNALGEKVITLFDGSVSNQVQYFNWNGQNGLGQNVPTGVYIYTLKTKERVESKKMLLMR